MYHISTKYNKMGEKTISNSQKNWDIIARSFDKTRRKPWEQCIRFINALPKNYVTADIACGNGRHLIPFAKRCKRVIGLDFSKELLKIVKEKLEKEKLDNVELLHSNVLELPLKDESIDAVLFIAAIHNIKGRENRIKTLKEIKRILKKNGKILISVWSRWQDKYRKEFFKRWFTQLGREEFGDIDIYWRQHGLNIPRFYHLYSKKEFLKDLKEAGFKIVEVEDVKMHSKRHPDNFFAFCKK